MIVSTLTLVACLAASAPVSQPAAQACTNLVARKGDKVLLNFEEQDLVVVVKRISKITGRNFIVDRGATHRRLTIISSTPVSPDDAYRAFLDALQGAELEVVEKGGFFHIRDKRSQPPQRAEESLPSHCRQIAGIEKTGESTWSIPKDVGRVFDFPRCAMVHVRVVPYFDNGKPAGFKIFAVRKKSLWAKLGFNNGDVIQSVNGKDISSPDKALEAYQALKTADKIEVAILRRGKPLKLTYIFE
jgi:hypothetical protein